MTRIRVAPIQLESQDKILANLERCEYLILAAAARGAQFVVLPENFAYFGDLNGRVQAAEVLGAKRGPIQAMLTRAVEKSGAAILAGGWPEASEGSQPPYNSATLYAP
jgi:deaminated glutathione amidase